MIAPQAARASVTAPSWVRRDGADDGGRPVTQSPPAKYAVHVVDLAAGLGKMPRPRLMVILLCSKPFHALSDGDYDPIRRNALFQRAFCLLRLGPALVIHLADDLRLRPERDRMALPVRLDVHGACNVTSSTPSATAPSTSSGSAVISSRRRR